jgi:stearoyl-CoA desaturase (delta-9 desaturase)
MTQLAIPPAAAGAVAANFTPTATQPRRPARWQQAITLALIGVPLAALVVGASELWGHGLSALDITLGVAFYFVAGHGVTVGYHRYLTHRSFTAARPLRLVLAIAGALAVEGGPIGWVSAHRKHHRFSDGPGDPHSPYRYGVGPLAQIRGLAHAHVGWLLTAPPVAAAVYAPDLVADRAIRRIDRLFPLLAAASLAAPFGIGWAVTGRLSAGISALLWAGLVRVALLHHVTWSVNSVCHMVGARPFRTRAKDRATNVWPLAILSMGESWHNLHHADPTCARHGVDRMQLDSSARLIRWFELAGWARDVRWPDRDRLARRRLAPPSAATVTAAGPGPLVRSRRSLAVYRSATTAHADQS